MTKFFSLLAVGSFVVLGSMNASATDAVTALVNKSHVSVRACQPDPNGNRYSICAQECNAQHSSGDAMANKACEDNCLARFCN